jgi:hypothetical protein
MPFVAYHVTDGPVAFPFATDAKHAISRFPAEWSWTPWTVAPAKNPTPDRITTAIADLTDRTIACRIFRTRSMDRLSAKLEAAAGVVGRVTANLEERADRVIAREDAINKRAERLFDAKHVILDSADAGLDGIEHKLALLSNSPLESSGPSPEVEPAPSVKEA